MNKVIITEEMVFRQRLCEYAKKKVNSKNDCNILSSHSSYHKKYL